MAGHGGDVSGLDLRDGLRDAHGAVGRPDPGDEALGGGLVALLRPSQPGGPGQSGELLPAGGSVLLQEHRQDDRVGQPVGHAVLSAQGVGHPVDNEGYVCMVNQKHFDRVMGLIDPAKVVYGGKGDPATRRIQPTILDHVTPEDAVMQEEIFGPVLPVLTFERVDEAVDFVNGRPHPLAAYLFSEDRGVQAQFLRQMPFGGGCINDTIIHLATSRMPFGGVGESGMGSYHGRSSFDTFSHRKSIVKKATWLDLPFRYAPYTQAKDKLIRMFLK